MKKEKKMAKQGIYVASTEELSGKSVVTIALALLAKDLGKKMATSNPLAWNPHQATEKK
jgi:Mrp family chromosome partitioning ATPase